MKTFILTIVAILIIAAAVPANEGDTITVRAGRQKTAARGELTIKFVSVVEDSRCPAGVNCVWAGNAQIRVRVTDRRSRSKLMLMNTGMGPKGDQFDGYAINLTSLTPKPAKSGKTTAAHYTATFNVTRLHR